MDRLVKSLGLTVSSETNPASQVFSLYMANILKQVPNPGNFTLLIGTADTQVSFYFKSPTTSEINANLYNQILSPRVKGHGSKYDVKQAELLSSAFINGYNQIYLSLRYQLSQADQAIMQQNVAKVAGSITTLRPIWNAWVEAFGAQSQPPVPKLNMNNTDTALIQMTGTMQGPWLNPAFVDKLKEDPSYPYQHMNDFDQIFSHIPLSVPKSMRDQIEAVYNAQGIGGGITAKVSNANQILNGVRNNIQQPSAENGGLKLTGSSRMIPGLQFEPADPITLTTILGTHPPDSLDYRAKVTKSESSTLIFDLQIGGGITIPIFDCFSLSVGGGAQTSIFESDFAGSEFEIEVVVNNPTLQPLMTVKPSLYNISTAQGWLYIDPVKEAIKNGLNTDVTGFVFDGGVPSFDFSEGGDFGYVDTLLLSQFLELKLTFKQCNSTKVRQYFEQNSNAQINFLGIPLGGASESSSYSYSYSEETSSSISISLKPNPPGYTPGGTGITQSLCNLVAVGVTYPLA